MRNKQFLTPLPPFIILMVLHLADIPVAPAVPMGNFLVILLYFCFLFFKHCNAKKYKSGFYYAFLYSLDYLDNYKY